MENKLDIEQFPYASRKLHWPERKNPRCMYLESGDSDYIPEDYYFCSCGYTKEYVADLNKKICDEYNEREKLRNSVHAYLQTVHADLQTHILTYQSKPNTSFDEFIKELFTIEEQIKEIRRRMGHFEE